MHVNALLRIKAFVLLFGRHENSDLIVETAEDQILYTVVQLVQEDWVVHKMLCGKGCVTLEILRTCGCPHVVGSHTSSSKSHYHSSFLTPKWHLIEGKQSVTVVSFFRGKK